jgi:hypothetical protein
MEQIKLYFSCMIKQSIIGYRLVKCVRIHTFILTTFSNLKHVIWI